VGFESSVMFVASEYIFMSCSSRVKFHEHSYAGINIITKAFVWQFSE
jgi:hypothetical protein